MKKSFVIAVISVILFPLVGILQSKYSNDAFFDENVDVLMQNEGATGTCCKGQDAICVVGDLVFYDYYYISEGPCMPVAYE